MIIFRPGDFVEFTNPYNNCTDYEGIIFEVISVEKKNCVVCKKGSETRYCFVSDALSLVCGPLFLESPIKCECGSEKTGSNRHSTWCPKGNL